MFDTPILNKGSAFPENERRELGLLGLLPFHSSSVDEQVTRTYENYKSKDPDIERYVFLTALQDRNETLFYRLVLEHITEMMPIIHTPTVGLGCQLYNTTQTNMADQHLIASIRGFEPGPTLIVVGRAVLR